VLDQMLPKHWLLRSTFLSWAYITWSSFSPCLFVMTLIYLCLASSRSYASSYVLAKYSQVSLSNSARIRRAYPAPSCYIPLILPHTRYHPRRKHWENLRQGFQNAGTEMDQDGAWCCLGRILRTVLGRFFARHSSFSSPYEGQARIFLRIPTLPCGTLYPVSWGHRQTRSSYKACLGSRIPDSSGNSPGGQV